MSGYYEYMVAVTFSNKEMVDKLFSEANNSETYLRKMFYNDFLLACIHTDRMDILCEYLPLMESRLINYFIITNYINTCTDNDKRREFIKKILCFIPRTIIEGEGYLKWL